MLKASTQGRSEAFNEVYSYDHAGGVHVLLGFNTNGVNHFHGQNKQHSFWPPISCLFNLPKHIRTKSDAFILRGIVRSHIIIFISATIPNLVTSYTHRFLAISERIMFSAEENHTGAWI